MKRRAGGGALRGQPCVSSSHAGLSFPGMWPVRGRNERKHPPFFLALHACGPQEGDGVGRMDHLHVVGPEVVHSSRKSMENWNRDIAMPLRV